jgi:hypothetical protein
MMAPTLQLLRLLRLGPSAIILRLPLCLIMRRLMSPTCNRREGQLRPLIITRLFLLFVVLPVHRHCFVNQIFPGDPLLHSIAGHILDYAVCRCWGNLLVWVEKEWDGTRQEWEKVQTDVALREARVAWAEQWFERAVERRGWREGRIDAALRGLTE